MQKELKPRTIKVKLTFRRLEFNIIEREVDAETFQRIRETASPHDWLEAEFLDDPMSDCDVDTDTFELDSWEIVKEKQR